MIKTLTALAAAGAIAITTIAVPAPAQAGSKSGAVAAGVIGGLAAGAIIGSAVSQPRYYTYDPSPYAYSRCYTVRQRVWTNNGPRWRRVRVCDY